MNTPSNDFHLLKNLKPAIFAVLLISLGACSPRSKGGLPPCSLGDPLPPVNLAPGSYTVVDSLTLTFTWEDPSSCQPDGYRIRIFSPMTVLIEEAESTSTSWIPSSPLEPGTTYDWQVGVAVEGMVMDYSTHETFLTGPICSSADPDAYSVPVLLAPDDGAIITTTIVNRDAAGETWTTPDFRMIWEDATRCLPPEGYDIEVSRFPSFPSTDDARLTMHLSDLLIRPFLTEFLFTFPRGYVWEECAPYFWRVKTNLPGTIEDPYSDTWFFIINTTGAICPPSDFRPTIPGPEIFVPPPGHGAISGHVWHDECAVPYESTDVAPPGCIFLPDGGLEANGLLDPEEIGIEGVVVRLEAGACPAEDGWTSTTDVNGQFGFYDLHGGVYCVSVDATADGNDRILIPGSWTFPERWYGPGPIELEVTLLNDDDIQRNLLFGWDYQFLPAPSPTSTPIVPMATILQNANCRKGPGTSYDVVTSMLEGQTAFIDGRNQENTWWWIRIPQSQAHCWVADGVVQITGPVNGLPIIQAPSLPTPTNTLIQGCWVWNANLQQNVCTVPCPPNPQPGGTCTP